MVHGVVEAAVTVLVSEEEAEAALVAFQNSLCWDFDQFRPPFLKLNRSGSNYLLCCLYESRLTFLMPCHWSLSGSATAGRTLFFGSPS